MSTNLKSENNTNLSSYCSRSQKSKWSQWAKTKQSEKQHFFPRDYGRSIFLSFPASRSYVYSLAHDPFRATIASQNLFSCFHISLLPFFPLTRMPVILLVYPGNSRYSLHVNQGQLIAKYNLICKLNYSLQYNLI